MSDSTIDVTAVEIEKTPVDAQAQLAKAKEIVKNNVAWSAGAGLIPVPGFDLVAITGVQLKMINELCLAYDVPFNKSLARPIVISLISSLGAGMLAPVLASTTMKVVPGIGLLLAGTALAATSAGITYAVGNMFTDHFSCGGTLENFNLINGCSTFKCKVKEGMKETQAVKEAAAA
ncbi:DUF697 domain-containing protein [Orrella sp. NBD-18]|uniref:DUF697 domain-containing protein n=1 Tax=Sheuella amnicola TaxID=2707330 RepID=A0A6B2QZP9_9BURK|nr:DUF697 domain-containing protein [Sheuella amnicola]NDY83996.1 DUF697 domain-containing protein [Sheuella amnicola]HBI83819.1 hypothetical protein [Alcaligenaceae bacterium]